MGVRARIPKKVRGAGLFFKCILLKFPEKGIDKLKEGLV